jgi:flagellin
MASNPVSLLNSANQSINAQGLAIARLSSGVRINSSKDDAAGLAIATQLATQMGSNSQAVSNISSGLALTDIAGAALGQTSDTLQRMRELAVQASNGTNNSSDVQAIQKEFSQLSQSLDQASSQTQYNGQNLLDGSFNATLQTGPNAGDTQQLVWGSVSTQALGLANVDVSSSANASSALGAIDQALSTVGAQQSSIGASQASLNAAANNLSVTYDNLASAQGQINDTDYASESASLAQSNASQEISLKMLAIYNANQTNVLSVFPGGLSLTTKA